jgi:enoyl-CoA hydratase
MDVALLKTLELYKPVVAAVNGWALAGGTELLQATDIRVASTNARFGLSEAKRGIVPGGGSMARLARQVPWCVAMEILLTGDDISADDALRVGLVNRVVPPDRLLPEAQRYADVLAANGPLALQAIKESVIRSSGVPIAEAFAIEAELSARVLASEDAREGPRAFVEKRPARFTGR